MSGGCKWPGCSERATRFGWACAAHWSRLPVKVRQSLGHSHRPGAAPDVYRERAEAAARDWILRERTKAAKVGKPASGGKPMV